MSYFSSIKENDEKSSALNEFDCLFNDYHDEFKEDHGEKDVHNDSNNSTKHLSNNKFSDGNKERNQMDVEPDSFFHTQLNNFSTRLVSLEQQFRGKRRLIHRLLLLFHKI